MSKAARVLIKPARACRAFEVGAFKYEVDKILKSFGGNQRVIMKCPMIKSRISFRDH